MTALLLLALFLGGGPSAAAVPDPSNPLDRALAAEIARSTASMRQEGYPPPYYVGLRVTDARSEEIHCVLGGVANRYGYRQRLLTPDIRVGGYGLDNHPLSPQGSFSAGELPAAADEAALGHAIWEDLDERYKAAAAGFLQKQAARVRRGKTDYDTDDMTRETPLVKEAVPPEAKDGLEASAAAAAEACVAASREFLVKPDLLASDARVVLQADEETFFNSEGTAARYGRSSAQLELRAEALSPDGMRQFAARRFLARSVSGLPSAGAARDVVAQMRGELEALQAASSTSPLNAPALIDPSVSAAVLEAIALRLSGEEQRNPDGAQTFRDKLGKKVMPEFLSLDDDPTLAEFGGKPLVGHYEIDDEGVEARKVVLVEKGALRSFLLSRYPVVGAESSNGHGRAAPGHMATGRLSVLLLRSTAAVSGDRMLEALKEECRRRGKPYGLYIRKSRSWMQHDQAGQRQAFRLMPTLVYLVDAKTGRQTLVRDLDMVGTPLDLMGKILAVGNDPQAVESMLEQPSGSLPVSVIVPTLLLQEVELQRAGTKPEKPPALPPPNP